MVVVVAIFVASSSHWSMSVALASFCTRFKIPVSVWFLLVQALCWTYPVSLGQYSLLLANKAWQSGVPCFHCRKVSSRFSAFINLLITWLRRLCILEKCRKCPAILHWRWTESNYKWKRIECEMWTYDPLSTIEWRTKSNRETWTDEQDQGFQDTKDSKMSKREGNWVYVFPGVLGTSKGASSNWIWGVWWLSNSGYK
jgi:hypothetical protein